MDTCPDCLRPLFQDLLHRCQRADEAGPRRTLPGAGVGLNGDESLRPHPKPASPGAPAAAPIR